MSQDQVLEPRLSRSVVSTPTEVTDQTKPEAANPEPVDPSTDARTLANRNNAQKSCGPKTEAGREISSRNATKHGLFVADLSKYLSPDELARYDLFTNGIVNDLHPVGDLEFILARRAADIQFRLELLRTAELHSYSGYYTLSSSMASRIDNHRDPLALVSLYDSRFTRSFKATMDELRQLQKARKEEELAALKELKAIASAHFHQGKTFDPAIFGFDISRELVFQKAHFNAARGLADNSPGNDRVQKMVVDCTAKKAKKAA
jgi:hypothetical protein